MEKTPEKKKNNKILARALASVLAGIPAAEAVAQSAQTARVEQVLSRSERVIVSTRGGRREVSIEYSNSQPVFLSDTELAERGVALRENGIQSERIYLTALGANPVVSLDSDLTESERRTLALQISPDAIISSFLASGLPDVVDVEGTRLTDLIYSDLVYAGRLSQEEIEARQRFLVPGLIADGMTQGGGPDGIRPVDLGLETVQLPSSLTGRNGISFGAEVFGTYLIEMNGRNYVVTVFAPAECWNFSFTIREVRVTEAEASRIPAPEIIEPEAEVPACIDRTVRLERLPSRREQNTVVSMSFTYNRNTAQEVSVEEVQDAENRGCFVLTIPCNSCENDATRWSVENVAENVRGVRERDLRAVDFQVPVVSTDQQVSDVLIRVPTYVVEINSNGNARYLRVEDVWTAACFQYTNDRGQRLTSSALTVEPSDYPYVQTDEVDSDMRTPMWTPMPMSRGRNSQHHGLYPLSVRH